MCNEKSWLETAGHVASKALCTGEAPGGQREGLMVGLDDRTFTELITESQDLHVDAMKQIKATLPDLAEIREQRRGQEIDTAEIERFNLGRRAALTRLGYGTATVGMLTGGFGGMFAGLLATPAYADQSLDVQMLQTASSLERLAVNTYGTALTLPFIKNGNAVVVKFAQTTMQHQAILLYALGMYPVPEVFQGTDKVGQLCCGVREAGCTPSAGSGGRTRRPGVRATPEYSRGPCSTPRRRRRSARSRGCHPGAGLGRSVICGMGGSSAGCGAIWAGRTSGRATGAR